MLPKIYTSRTHISLFLFRNKSNFYGKRFFVLGKGPLCLSDIMRFSTSTNSTPKASFQSLPILYSNKAVSYWLFLCAGLVFGVVVVGGITRLTESGLSMVDWSFLHFRPPSSEEEWASYFDKYKNSPEFILLNNEISLNDFKRIYYMEYGHRMLGRLVGAAYFFPLIFFLCIRGPSSFKKSTIVSLSLIGSLIVFQGFLGWYMVKSGLDPEIIDKRQHPRVSHYRLAAHLTTAFAIYLLMIRTAFSLLNPRLVIDSGEQVRPIIKKLHSKINGAVHFIALTAISGAFVAGLDAGLIYNTFPKMGRRWIPDDLISEHHSLLDNPTAVQFFHRILAYCSFTYILYASAYGYRKVLPHIKVASYKRTVSTALTLFLGAGIAQVTLGLCTLLWMVPIPVAAMHQAGSLVLLTTGSWGIYLLKRL